MSHEPDMMQQELVSLSRNGLFHCKAGQETVHDIVAKTTELFNHLKSANAALQKTPDNEAKRAKIRDILTSIQHKFDALQTHYNHANEISSSLAYVQVKSLIPFKDDPENIEQIRKHRRNLYADPTPEAIKEREELIKKISEKDDQLRQITDDLRQFIYEINTMLHVDKN